MLYHPDREFELNTDCDEAVGLVGWWPLGAYPDGRDMSIRGNHGRPVNGPLASGAGNTLGLRFDGVDDYVRTNTDGSTLNALSISLWVTRGVSATTDGIYQWANILESSTPSVYLRDAAGVLSYYVNFNYNLAGGTLANDTWTYLALTWDGVTWKCYFNGVQNSTYVGGHYLVAPVFWMANGYHGYWDGLLDDVRIHNRALSATQVQKSFLDGLSGGYGPLARARRRWAIRPPSVGRLLHLRRQAAMGRAA